VCDYLGELGKMPRTSRKESDRQRKKQAIAEIMPEAVSPNVPPELLVNRVDERPSMCASHNPHGRIDLASTLREARIRAVLLSDRKRLSNSQDDPRAKSA
jgi:hypothetical protein